MDTQSGVVRHSQLLKLPVLDRETAESLGKVEQLWLDPHAHQVMGLTCKSGLLGRKKHSFSWANVEAVGKDGMFVHTTSSQQGEKDAQKKAEEIVDHEIWTDSGSKAGKVVDYLLQSKTGEVAGYLYDPDQAEGTYLLEPVAISSVGKKRVIVLERAVNEAPQYSEGIKQKLEQARESLKKDFAQRRKELEGAASQAQGKAQETASQVRDQAQSAGNKAQEKVSETRAKFQNSSQSDSTQAEEQTTQTQNSYQSDSTQAEEQTTQTQNFSQPSSTETENQTKDNSSSS
ncbi:MAG: photosystem reaction center subunit H [Cyanobacteria bacterium QS_1_48_34]|nr:MAG: photosystem reaction center subunit H [Cyanobacteria bacterium QS_1_48_34]